jgi:hypothetical protein
VRHVILNMFKLDRRHDYVRVDWRRQVRVTGHGEQGAELVLC